MFIECPVCGIDMTPKEVPDGASVQFECSKCGMFLEDQGAETSLVNEIGIIRNKLALHRKEYPNDQRGIERLEQLLAELLQEADYRGDSEEGY